MNRQRWTYYLVIPLLFIVNFSIAQCNIDAGVDTVVNCTNPSVTLNGSGGTVYAWTPSTGLSNASIANPIATPTVTTTYTLKITGGDGCIETENITVTVDNTPPTAVVSNNITIDCSIQPTATLTASGGVAYSWTPSTGLSNASIANPVASPTVTTAYEVTVKAANGCTDKDTVIVTVDKDLPLADAGTDDTINCIVLAVNLAASGGVSYSWSPSTGLSNPSIANPVATPLATTQYTVSVTGANGCVATDQVKITVDNLDPTAFAGADVINDCNTPTTTFAATGGATYSWLPSTGLSDPTLKNPIANPAVTTNYIVTVTGTNGCTDTDDIIVVVDKDPPIANAGPDFGTTCAALNAQLLASGGVEYSWSPTTALSNPLIANPIATPTTTVIYTVTVKGANGCTATDQTVVTLNDITPTADAGIDQEICGAPSTNLAPDISSNSVTDYFTWGAKSTNPTLVTFTDINDPFTTIGNLQEGVYTLYWTVSNNVCPPVQDTMLVTVYNPPVANAGLDDSLCAVNNTNLKASPTIGSATGEWTLQADFSNPNPTAVVFADSSVNTTNVSGLEEGVYRFIWTVSNGICAVDKDTVQISVFNMPTADAGLPIDLCSVYTTNLAAAVPIGTAQGFWYIDSLFGNPSSVTFSDNASPVSTLSGLQEGAYQLVWETYNGNCPVARDSTVISVYDQPIANAGVALSVCGIDSLNTDTLFFLNAVPSVGTASGSWTVDAGFGNPSVAIFIDPTDPFSGVTNLLEGVHQFIWTVSNGTCTASSATVAITAFDSPFSKAGLDQALCGIYAVDMAALTPVGTSTGAWSADASFGNPSVITFNDPTNPTTNTTGYIEGVYQFIWTVSNSNCAPKDDTLQVVIYDTPSANAGVDIQICDTSIISFLGVAPMGTATGSWSADANFGNLTNIVFLNSASPTTQGSGFIEGTYQFIWTVSNGVCPNDYDTVQVISYNSPVATAGADQYLCELDSVQLSGGGNVGTAIGEWIIDASYSYSSIPVFRDSSNASTMANNFTVGDYPLIFTVKNGVCPISSDTVFIYNKPKPVASYEYPTTVCDNKCFNLTSLSIAPVGETLTHSWTLAGNNYSDSVALACLWQVGVEDIKLVITASNGCQDSIMHTNAITVNPSPTADFNMSYRGDSLLELQRLDITNNASSDVVSFVYDLGNGDTLTDENFIYSYPNYGLYPITQWVENQFGCRDSVSYGRRVGKRRSIYIPNTFTPNGDGVNDLFGPVSRDLSNDFYEFTISNRLGKKIFVSEIPNEKWDGRIDGRLVQDGTFIWSLMYLFEGEIEVQTIEGHVTILK